MQTLKEIREARGVTKEAVCRHLGITAPTYTKYERNPKCMSIATFEKVCAFLHCDQGDIFLEQDHN